MSNKRVPSIADHLVSCCGNGCIDKAQMAAEIVAMEAEIERLRFLVTQGRHVLFKKGLITFDEIKNWQV